MTSARKYNINCDMGESVDNDSLIMPLIDSCSVACGGHTGDEQSMKATLDLANHHQVKVGAHPSYPDKPNFGRAEIKISPNELLNSLIDQVGQLQKYASEKSDQLHHIKVHGALYNQAAEEPEIAQLLLVLMASFPGIPMYVPWNSVLHQLLLAENKPFILEAFADRKYEGVGRLVSRKLKGSVITDPEAVFLQVNNIVESNKVATRTGEKVEIHADTFCVHGDNPNALAILKRLNP